MAHLILPKPDLKRMIRERREWGADRYDEVWEGTYVMSPIADIEHMELVGVMTSALLAALGGVGGARVVPGCNVTDDAVKWTRNYRVPDVVVLMPGSHAQIRGTHLLGGPDLAVEILSPNDRSRKKLGFYASVGVRELLLVDRDPWGLELYRLSDGELRPAGVVTPESNNCVESEVTGLELRLVVGEERPGVELRRRSDGATWTV